ncbi:hypothetical protein K491DRAFT_680794 [Lophiostoma macrostomum CBS 122681]|uniref:Uncharacterized protein n=1 Tax=Lophiostoma macrostomum CBS 122681 TaxID=1314788 RepID=A0A6A6T1U1_9PLEO|nr:hypothetical protein K491DRAFT_680794 [Lophiostoma macrostomum CBS 122681]
MIHKTRFGVLSLSPASTQTWQSVADSGGAVGSGTPLSRTTTTVALQRDGVSTHEGEPASQRILRVARQTPTSPSIVSSPDRGPRTRDPPNDLKPAPSTTHAVDAHASKQHPERETLSARQRKPFPLFPFHGRPVSSQTVSRSEEPRERAHAVFETMSTLPLHPTYGVWHFELDV